MNRAPAVRILKGACGRPSSLCAWPLLVLLGASPVLARCPLPAASDPVSVRHVIDGDTVVLGDRRHLRLVGINTPELGRDGAPDEPGARTARSALQDLLARDGLRLVLAPQPRDRHRRWLGDLYDQRGRSVQELLVEAGQALAVAVPPNLAQVECLFDAERRARRAGRGLWATPADWIIPATALARDRRGFAVVSGRISAVRQQRAGMALQVEDHLEVWIPRAAQAGFGDALAELQVGRSIEVRGWLGVRRGQPNLRLEHPAMLERRP